MSNITIFLDGQKVEARPGMSVLEAALAAGIYIPNLCADPDLRPFGACRACVVEIEGMRGLPASCSVTAASGMVIRTDTPLVEKTRRTVLELLLADHPEECLSCPKNNRCSLQTAAAYVGVREHRFPRTMREIPIDDSNPFFTYNMNKCILCGKCVRACDELQGLANVTFMNRGFATKVGFFMDRRVLDSPCESCGQCEAKCPVGAISVKGYQHPTRKIRTVCSYCGVGCGLLLHVRGTKVVGAEGDRESPVSHGSLCVKGRFGHDYVNHADRLSSPLIRKDGELVETGWEEALELVSSRLAEYAWRPEGSTSASFAGLSSAKCTNEENYLFQKFARAVMGTNSVDHCARV
jgi:predicted molibdopterin-dependent oxidoreductase YjgC